ncbi:rRNA maturation RNase YbeY [uncultured Eudoraea sp.]|uniref:rRNA maturation RNase YbeY n=1 Tax=uncultured Eudoraea sp. TaxID=1035614 RepID=UPI00262161E8|nr:rRNA maturation RNase YbeY [uncultured Eudoraea sp.]
MINYHYETEFDLENIKEYTSWINTIVVSENVHLGDLSYIFCSDEYLIKLNQKYLGHDTYTDIVTFNYSEEDVISGEIYISVDRVKENAVKFKEDFKRELRRVMAHGVLHLLGYNDKSKKEKEEMRTKEDEKINMFHVKQ